MAMESIAIRLPVFESGNGEQIRNDTAAALIASSRLRTVFHA